MIWITKWAKFTHGKTQPMIIETPHRRPRMVSFNIPSSDDEALQSTNSTTEEDYFLGRRELRKKGNQRKTTTIKLGQGPK